MSHPLPHASEFQAERAIEHVKAVLNAAENSNQHGENMIVLMDRATALYQRNLELENALEEALEFIERQVDVVDGDYGEPAPNEAMKLASLIKDLIPGALTNT